MTKADILSEKEYTVTLELDNNESVDCQVLTIFNAGSQDYIALLPVTGPEAETGNVYLYRFTETETDPILENILTDEEFEIASEGWDEYLDSVEFDELVSFDDEDGEEE